MDNSNRTSHCNVGHSIGSSGKTFEKTPGQRNSRTGMQRGLMHCSKTLSDRGVSWSSDLNLHDSITLEFNLHFQDNSLSCDDAKEQELNQRQIAIYKLISYMKQARGMSYRKITKWLNRSGIKTHKGKSWGETGNSVYSVLKRMKERDYRLNTTKKFKTKSEITDFKITEF